MVKVWAALLATAGAGGAATPAMERVVSGDALLRVTVNGTPVTLRVEPGVPGLPLMEQATAERIGLKGGGMLAFGVGFRIGPEVVNGRTEVARVGWGGAPVKRRVGWISRSHDAPADGTVGPSGLPERVIRFVLRPAYPGERTGALPVEKAGLLAGWSPMRGVITVGDTAVAVRFDPHHRRSLATAAAAAAIARALGGTLTDERARQEVLFGVERPLRIMTLARPLAVGPLALSTLGVRVTDGAGANTIPQAGDDPSEVVVTGKGKKSYAILSIGADQLDRCSALVFDKPARQIRMSCR